MTFELLTSLITKAVFASLVLVPACVIGLILCIECREKRWVKPIWVFLACPVIGYFAMLALMALAASGVTHNPESGWAGMAIGLAMYFSTPMIIAGLLLLISFPMRGPWDLRLTLTCFASALLSCSLSVAYMRFAPDVHEIPRNVQLVIPDGYRGQITIRLDEQKGVEPQRVGKVTRYVIPASGALVTTDVSPLFEWHKDFATYANGDEVPDPATAHQRLLKRTESRKPTAKQMFERANWNRTEVCFFSRGTSELGHLFFVGTPWEFVEFRNQESLPRARQAPKGEDAPP